MRNIDNLHDHGHDLDNPPGHITWGDRLRAAGTSAVIFLFFRMMMKNRIVNKIPIGIAMLGLILAAIFLPKLGFGINNTSNQICLIVFLVVFAIAIPISSAVERKKRDRIHSTNKA